MIGPAAEGGDTTHRSVSETAVSVISTSPILTALTQPPNRPGTQSLGATPRSSAVRITCRLSNRTPVRPRRVTNARVKTHPTSRFLSILLNPNGVTTRQTKWPFRPSWRRRAQRYPAPPCVFWRHLSCVLQNGRCLQPAQRQRHPGEHSPPGAANCQRHRRL